MTLWPIIRFLLLLVVLALLIRLTLDHLALVLLGAGLIVLAKWLFKRL